MRKCRLCPRGCGVNRLKAERKECQVGRLPFVSSYNAHFGEEPPITGYQGSGTIFFTYCNLHCLYCQNYDISQLGSGREIRVEDLARIMVALEKQGCHNINLVSPTHQVPQILDALFIAVEKGLKIPIVYNTGGYDTLEVLRILDGIVDIYMPDMKYSQDDLAEKYSTIKNYPGVNRKAIKEMHRQVGDLRVDAQGVAISGLLIRHLVLPNNIAGTEETLRFIAEEVSPQTYVNLMSQYRPCFRAWDYPELARRPTHTEYREASEIKKRLGLTKGWLQG